MKKQEMKRLEPLVAPRGYDPLEAQRALQERMAERFPDRPILADSGETMAEVATVVYLNAMAAIVELSEMVDHLPVKWWKDYGSALDESPEEHHEALTEAAYELVDALHFMLNCAIAMGVDWTELLDIFYTKQQHNHDRQETGY